MVVKLVLSLIFVGFTLAATGQLTRATHYMMKLAVEAQRDDFVSLGSWNRALMGSQDHKRRLTKNF
jgi:hypothetical protein